MISTLSGSDMSQLHALACNAITQSHAKAFSEITAKKLSPTQWETIFVAHLCRAMVNVAHRWKNVFTKAAPGLGLSMATVFTHQTPYVKWVNGAIRRRCELADVLLVVIDRTSSTPKGVAVLVQAKNSTAGSVTLSSRSEKNQFDLLSTRPKFDVDAALAPTKIDLSHLSPDSALVYGLTSSSSTHLPSRHSGVHHWLTTDGLSGSAGTYKVTGEDCLAYLLTGMLPGKFGWEFDLPPKGNGWKTIDAASPRDDWSTLINYLLEATFAKPLTATHSASMGRSSRGQEDVLYLTAKNSSGRPMFFLGYEMTNSMAMQYFSQGGVAETSNWQPGSLDNETSISGSGNSTDDGDKSVTGEPPEGGPISAILFEIGT